MVYDLEEWPHPIPLGQIIFEMFIIEKSRLGH